MAYPGGKAGAGVYQTIINQIPPHEVYVEACLGDGAILRRLRSASRTIGIEIDRGQAEYFAAEYGAAAGAEVYCCSGIEWLRHAFGLYRVDRQPLHSASGSGVARSTGSARAECPGKVAVNGDRRRRRRLQVATATADLVGSQISAAAAAVAGNGVGGQPSASPRSPAAAAGAHGFSGRLGTPGLVNVSGAKLVRPARSAGVAGCSGLGRARSSGAGFAGAAGGAPAAECSGVSSPRVFVYLDPPYLNTKTRLRYRHKMDEHQHAELLAVCRQLPCMVMVSGYWSKLYAEAFAAWRVISFMATTRGGRPAREYLWMNYPEPEELHDYRYLGGNKRERERIARKVRTWSAGLARLPRLERLAIMAGIAGTEAVCG